MRAQLCGKHVLLVFDIDKGNASSTACEHDNDVDAFILAAGKLHHKAL
jgi:hypothetical protein